MKDKPMDTRVDHPGSGTIAATVERRGDRALVVTRRFSAAPATVYRAWSEPTLFRRWWVPDSMPGVALMACDLDVRTGGTYRLEFGAGGTDTMVFHGRYLDVVQDALIVWTNDEGEEGAVTTVIFEDEGGATRLTLREVYPSEAAREDALQGSAAALPEQLEQLGALLLSIGD
ncbi:SRPBCC domain-containing protein [Sphingomonas aurantiaca]|uniref:SRPBCC domain-containing protein n=1 Tax=Sphingomonas aurantiaca TaxID=185949 RepID=UPI002FE2416D